MTGIDPTGAVSPAEYVQLLRRRREVAALSYRQLEWRARQGGGSLPPSTVSTMLCRSTLPNGELVAAYVRACGGDDTEVGAWLEARARLAASAPPVSVTRSPSPAAASGSCPAVPPRQLPAALSDLVGRRRQLAELDAMTDGAGSALVVVTGAPGVGKTALSLHWAHSVTARFPDGQLYVDLGGHRPGPPLPTREALACLLVGLGVPACAVPADEKHAASAFRSLVADRRILLVLDGATTADQIRLLRPGGRHTCTVVTSRSALTGLSVHDGARTIDVPPLDPVEGARLLTRGPAREPAATEPTAVRLAELCDGLPLALRLVGAALVPGVPAPLADLVARMGAEGRLTALDGHAAAETGLRSAFACSYAALDDASRQLFRLLGTVCDGAFTAPAVAAVTKADVTRTRALLRRLADEHLLVRLGGDRYSLLGLMREYARGLGAHALPRGTDPRPAGAAEAWRGTASVWHSAG